MSIIKAYKTLFLFFIFYCIFFCYHLVPLYLPPPHSHSLLSMSMSPFSFLLIPVYPQNPLISCHPVLYESLFCSLVQFVHQIPHKNEIIWYLPFSAWLISLSIMFSGSIHTGKMVKFSSFLWPTGIPLCKCPTVVLSTHLLMGVWATSINWRL